jgi:cell division protein FtsX
MYLYLWQTNFWREFGMKGLLIGILGSLIIIAMIALLIRAAPLRGHPVVSSNLDLSRK